MELLGTVNNRGYTVSIEQKDEHRFEIEIEGRSYSVDCIELIPNLFSILHGPDSYEVRVHQNGQNGTMYTHFYSHTLQVEMADPMKKLLEESLGGGRKGEAALQAPMPGKIQRLLVKEGDEVQQDQGLLVLVAMKMENELGSPKAGVVKKILVKEGDNVEGAVPLIVVD